MRVVYRLTVLLVLVACLVLTASGVLTVRSEAVMFERSMIEDARLNGQTLRSALQEVARSQGFAAVEGLVSSARPGKLEFRCLAAPSQGSGEDALTAEQRAELHGKLSALLYGVEAAPDASAVDSGVDRVMARVAAYREIKKQIVAARD